MKKYVFLLSVFFLCHLAYSQISHGGEPYSFEAQGLKSDIDYVIMPEVDVEALMMEDAIDENDPEIPWRFGKDIPVEINLDNSGTWETLENGDRIWRLEITSYGAYSLNLIYKEFYMPSGATFFVYNPQKTHKIGSFTEENHKPNGGFATVPIKGETSILEYYEPAEFSGLGKLSVSYVIHAYRDFYANADKGFGSSGSCNVNANCQEGNDWQDQKRGVAMILTGNNARKCTGSMINNTAEDGTPYFLTANHCSDGNEDTWIIMFNYESPDCANVDGPTDQAVQHTTVRAKSYISDFMLVELSELPPPEYNVFYSGWNRMDESATNSVTIHHPRGDIKKISFDNDPYTSDKYLGNSGLTDSHWKITMWDLGTTEPGSSGSPLFNPQHQIVGQLHGGWASCTALDPDWYGKFAFSWDYFEEAEKSLKPWLDPLDLGVESLEGYDPSTTGLANNASIPSAIAPLQQYGGQTSIQPKFVIRNMGTEVMQSLNVSYQIEDGEILTQAWAGNLETYDTAHVTFPEIDLILGLYHFTAFVDSPNGLEDEYKNNDTLRLTVSVDLDYDISISNFISPVGVDCGVDSTKLKFFVANNGAQVINAVQAFVTIDGGVPVIYDLPGSISHGQEVYHVLSVLEQDTEWHDLSLEVRIDGQEDQYPTDNFHTTSYNTYGNSISLFLNTDVNGAETSWVIKNDIEEIVESGDNYESNQNYKMAFCLSNGCYQFVIYDSGGDGIIPDAGFTLENTTYQITYVEKPPFTDSLVVNFCISNDLSCDFTTISDSTCTNRDVNYINLSANADYYAWFFEGGMPIASNEMNPVVQYPNPGVYDVRLTSWQGDENIEVTKEDFITVVFCTGIDEVQNDLFSLYPNPSSGSFKLEIDSPDQYQLLNIYNAMGELVYSEELGQETSAQFDLDLVSGLYIVELKSEKASEKRMLMINR